MDLKKYIDVTEDFPKKGISFKDITTLMKNPEAFHYAIQKMAEVSKEMGAEIIVGPESRGFVFGCPVAYELNLGFVPVRKKGKLPRETISYTYDLEYGTDTLYIHKDDVLKGQKVVIIDDIVALGGTLNAVASMIESLGAEVVGIVTLLTLENLPGYELIKNKYNFYTMILDKE